MRLMTIRSASSSCFVKMYAACGEKPPFASPAQNAAAVAGLEQHGVGGHVERAAEKLLQRPHDRRHQVGATAHRLGQHDVGPGRLFQLRRPSPSAC